MKLSTPSYNRVSRTPTRVPVAFVGISHNGIHYVVKRASGWAVFFGDRWVGEEPTQKEALATLRRVRKENLELARAEAAAKKAAWIAAGRPDARAQA